MLIEFLQQAYFVIFVKIFSMRIISGKNKGRNIVPPKNFKARPTTDMAKEALMTILENNYEFASCSALDLFSGTGSISYEFASRNCLDITAVENFKPHADFIRKTSDALDFNIHVVNYDAFRFLKSISRTFDMIFADPPYDNLNIEKIPELVFENKILSSIGIFVLEHSGEHDFSKHANFTRHRNYGKVNFSFFENKTEKLENPKSE